LTITGEELNLFPPFFLKKMPIGLSQKGSPLPALTGRLPPNGAGNGFIVSAKRQGTEGKWALHLEVIAKVIL
jgi:hypothetical protein